ncbi:MAG: hypothetical protein EKK60_15485 [Gordonia sp. (in: high G+C Gram-positive bacteria)]|nr:MAG: hypothetical protein EKK60_15485 [Gordonia sp. (in: high G+C Gram-positive bacteria)]
MAFARADNARVPQRGAMGGWDQLRARLKGEDGRPMIYMFDTCTHLIRTLPSLQHDEARPEDVDTEGEDHAPDECRYACMSRPYIPAPAAPVPKGLVYEGLPDGTIRGPAIRDMIDAARKKRAA